MVDAPTLTCICAAVSPPHFQANVARWRSSEPSRVGSSAPARGGSANPLSVTESMPSRP